MHMSPRQGSCPSAGACTRSVNAFQGIDLPRKWNDSEHEPDDDPYEQLRAMFERVRAALYAWGEVMDHLRPSGKN